MAWPSDPGFLRNSGVPLLQRQNRQRSRPKREDGIARRARGGKRRGVRNPIGDRRLPHRVVVPLGFFAERSVDQQLYVAVEHHVHPVRPALMKLEDRVHWNSTAAEMLRRSTRREELEPHLLESSRNWGYGVLVGVVDRYENRALAGQHVIGRELRLAKCAAK